MKRHIIPILIILVLISGFLLGCSGVVPSETASTESKSIAEYQQQMRELQQQVNELSEEVRSLEFRVRGAYGLEDRLDSLERKVERATRGW